MQAIADGRRSSRGSTDAPAWKALEAHYEKVATLHLRELFADDRSAASA